jgi:hypothetical protein
MKEVQDVVESCTSLSGKFFMSVRAVFGLLQSNCFWCLTHDAAVPFSQTVLTLLAIYSFIRSINDRVGH